MDPLLAIGNARESRFLPFTDERLGQMGAIRPLPTYRPYAGGKQFLARSEAILAPILRDRSLHRALAGTSTVFIQAAHQSRTRCLVTYLL